MRTLVRLVVFTGGLLLLGACTAHSDRIAAFRQAWHRGELQGAQHEIDRLISDELGLEPEQLDQSPALATGLDLDEGNNVLYALEKATLCLAEGQFDVSRTLLRKSRGYYDEHLESSIGDMFASLADDETRSYVGNDYEHLLLRVYAGLCEMMEGGEEATSHMLSVDEVQERILNSDLGQAEGGGYKPRARYKRLMIGSYLAGVLLEGEAEGEQAYARFRIAEQNQLVQTRLLQEALQRTKKGEFAPYGFGALHVFYFGGRGPYYVEGRDEASDLAVSLAKIGIAVAGKSASALIQAEVPVPKVVVSDLAVPPLSIQAGDCDPVETELICELNSVAISQLEANMPWIMARQLARRSLKAGIAAATERAVAKNSNDSIAGFLAGLAVNLALTAGERAETRCWTSLPAQVQAARVVLAKGVHRVELSDGNYCNVRIEQGRNSYLLVFRPNLQQPGFFVVDKYSMVEEPLAEPDAEAPDAEFPDTESPDPEEEAPKNPFSRG